MRPLHSEHPALHFTLCVVAWWTLLSPWCRGHGRESPCPSFSLHQPCPHPAYTGLRGPQPSFSRTTHHSQFWEGGSSSLGTLWVLSGLLPCLPSLQGGLEKLTPGLAFCKCLVNVRSFLYFACDCPSVSLKQRFPLKPRNSLWRRLSGQIWKEKMLKCISEGERTTQITRILFNRPRTLGY
jgi:hypothetical protein